MEKLKVFFYACVEFDDKSEKIHMHSGMTADRDEASVREDIEHNYIEPRYISIQEVTELRPTYDENGDPVGFMRVGLNDEAGCPQGEELPVDNCEGCQAGEPCAD